MTRMWCIRPDWICDQHLVAEHAECHQEAGTLLNHPHGEAIVEGHAVKGQVDVSLLETRHDTLVDEMEKRGMNHDSPFDYDISEYEDMGYVDIYDNIADLRERCDDCAERMD